MCTAVTMRTPARAARGMRATSPAPAITTATRTTACTMAATRVRAPARTLTAVRAMAPVAGIPPKSGASDVGHALAEQLPVRVVGPAVGHAVGDLGRQQALDGGQGGDRERGAEVAAGGPEVDRR